MREIKIRYRIRSKNFPSIIDTSIVTLEQIEKGYISDIYKGCEIVSKDLFIGLYDKNGREIYQTDIIKTRNLLWAVNFNINYHGYVIERRLKTNPDGFAIEKIKDTNYYEVVGNVYDDPDLLK